MLRPSQCSWQAHAHTGSTAAGCTISLTTVTCISNAVQFAASFIVNDLYLVAVWFLKLAAQKEVERGKNQSFYCSHIFFSCSRTAEERDKLISTVSTVDSQDTVIASKGTV